ncbi:hypothetical protein OQL67_004355 [Salmonella enterica]|nr:hypothetical protein [Salmonella enterica]
MMKNNPYSENLRIARVQRKKLLTWLTGFMRSCGFIVKSLNAGEKAMRGNLWRWIWRQVWMLSETTGISLGRFAPWVFHQMIGCDTPCRRMK